jgi:hypothetical protein
MFFSQTAAGEHKAVSQFAKSQCGTERDATIFRSKECAIHPSRERRTATSFLVRHG